MPLYEALNLQLAGLDRNRVESIWNKSVLLKRGEFLCREGQRLPYLYFIESGAVRVFYESNEEELTIRFGYKDNFIMVLPSFLKEGPAVFNVQAIKATKVVGISRPDFDTLLNQNPRLQHIWRIRMEHLVVEQLEREIDILTSSPGERYRRVLERSPQLFQEIPLKYIANYLRMTPETLSRLRNS